MTNESTGDEDRRIVSEPFSGRVSGRNLLPPLEIEEVAEGEDAVGATLEEIRRYCTPRVWELEKSGENWKKLSRYLGLPATGMAAVAGVTGLANESFQVLAGVLALGGSVLGAIVASLTPASKSEEYFTQSKQMAALRRNISILLYVDRSRIDDGEMREALEDVLRQLDAIERTNPAPSLLYRLKANTLGGIGQ